MAVSSGFAFDLPMSASGDLSSAQYYFVTQASTAKRVQVATGACGPAPLGVLQNDPTSGEEATVRILGSTKVYTDASSAIVYGDFLTSGSDGQAVITTASAFHAMALEDLASGDGVVTEVLLIPHGAYVEDNTP